MPEAPALSTAELCTRYRKLWVPVVCDALYDLDIPELVLPSRLRPLFPEGRLVGEAFTVEGRALPDIGWERGIERMQSYLEMFERLTPDTVLVSTTPSGRAGHFGELTANSARKHGCVGAIIDGNLRDVEGMREIGFPVFYRDLSPINGIGRWEMIASQEPVTIGDVIVTPGDIVVAEFDGIVIVPRGEAERVLLKSEEISAAESRVRSEMREGVSPLDSFKRHGHI